MLGFLFFIEFKPYKSLIKGESRNLSKILQIQGFHTKIVERLYLLSKKKYGTIKLH